MGFLRARKAARLSQKAAVQLCSEWQYCLEPGCSGLCWELCSVPWEQGAQPRLLEPGTGGYLPTLARAMLLELLSADMGM